MPFISWFIRGCGSFQQDTDPKLTPKKWKYFLLTEVVQHTKYIHLYVHGAQMLLSIMIPERSIINTGCY